MSEKHPLFCLCRGTAHCRLKRSCCSGCKHVLLAVQGPHKSPELAEEKHGDLAVVLLLTRADGPVLSLLWWIFYSGLEHMTILGHQRGPSYMLLPLRPHCAASDLMSQQRLWRSLLLFHNSQLSVSSPPPQCCSKLWFSGSARFHLWILFNKSILSTFWRFNGWISRLRECPAWF